MEKKRFIPRDRGATSRKILLTAKLFILFLFCSGLCAGARAQQEKVTLELREVSLSALFNEIQKQTRLSFVFNVEQTRDLGPFSVTAASEEVSRVLDRVFAGTGVTFEYAGSLIVVRPAESPQVR